MDDHEKRISVAEANILNIGSVIVELKDYMKNSSASRAANHNEIIQRLSVIETKQDEFKAYQEACDADREKLSDDVLDLKLTRSNQAGKASVWSVVTAAITSGAIAVLTALYEGHK